MAKWNGSKWEDDAESMRVALTREAELEKIRLLKQAHTAIATLQDAVVLGMASREETLLLTAWKKYRVLLNRIQAEDAPEIVWPEVPEMWREARLAFTDSVAALNCSIVPAHPWIYGLGQQTANGAYLSPVNAVRYLAERPAGTGECGRGDYDGHRTDAGKLYGQPE